MKYCSAPWDTIHIHPDGKISSCFCIVWHKKGYNGNILETSLTDLFNNDYQTEFRQSILDQSFVWCRSDTCVNFYRTEEVTDFNFVKPVNLPTVIQLQIDKNCNLKCDICRTVNIYSPIVNSTADKILNKLIDEYKDFNKRVNIHCDGIGDIFASAAYLKFFANENLPKNFYFSLQTNGNLISKNIELVTKLQEQIELVEISLDAAKDSTYKMVRGGNLTQVLTGIQLLKQLNIKVWTQYVVQRRNFREIPEYVNLCKSLNVDRICLQLMNREGHMSNSWWNENSVESFNLAEVKELTEILNELTSDPTIEISGGLEHILSLGIEHNKRT